jgi:TfoX/Sxy family transcriptional regulator of competence genes
LYFKVDAASRAAFVERGMGPFTYEKASRTLAMNYFEVPPDVLENREELAAWANRAIQVAAARTKNRERD